MALEIRDVNQVLRTERPDGVLYRPILRAGRVIGYLWATPDMAGFRPRGGGAAADDVQAYWMRWLRFAWERGLTTAEALVSWNPAYEFPCGAPAPGPPTELAELDALWDLAGGDARPGGYAEDSRTPVRHYPVRRDGLPIGHLWASVDETAAGFLPSPDLAPANPAISVWQARLASSHSEGLTPTQALQALRDAPDDGTTGHLTDPLGQSYLSALRSR